MPTPRLTLAEAKRLGVEHLWPKPPPSRHEPDGMNKLERTFHARLQEAVRQRIFIAALREPLVLRLAGNTTYKPDFWTIALPSTMTFWEVKGFMRDDAAVKLKVAAAQAAWFRWVLVQRDRGRWRCIDVTERGFSREEWCPDWLS